MTIQYLQHVSFEGLGSIETWAKNNRREVRAVRLFAGEPLPDLQDTDLLVVLGGPMNVYDDTKFPFLAAEKRFIERAMRADKSVLGICLGAQLVADVLGAKVYRGEEEEIGWFPVETINNEAASASSFSEIFPESFETLHWHGDTFSIPAGATHLLSSAGCAHQAFSYGSRVLGVQFHPEITPEAVRLMVENEGDEIGTGRYVQTAEQILSPEKPFAENAAILSALLNKLTQIEN